MDRREENLMSYSGDTVTVFSLIEAKFRRGKLLWLDSFIGTEADDENNPDHLHHTGRSLISRIQY